MIRWIAAAVLACAPLAAAAQGDPGAEARAASDMLAEATRALDEADGAASRVKALSQTVRAFEAGLRARPKSPSSWACSARSTRRPRP
jgi:hypothetical protein